jgi:hypothetical protein
MVPREPPHACGETAEDPQRQTPGPLPVLRASDELLEYLAVLSGGPADLAKVAQPAHSWKPDDLGEMSLGMGSPILAGSSFRTNPVSSHRTFGMPREVSTGQGGTV